MKHFFLACLFPTLLTAQNMQLTERLGKTVLYDDIAVSPNGTHVAWVQSTAATTSKQTHIRGTSGNAATVPVNLATTGERKDSGPAWSPDSKMLAVFSSAGEKEQRQLWMVNADGSNPQKFTNLKGYAAGPRWSPDGKSVAFIEGLMSDEGFHGGDLFTISADGHGALNRTQGRKSSVSSIFWQRPDRILFTEIVGGGSAISELTLDNNSVRTIWKGAEDLHAFGNFPNFAVSKDDKFAAAERSSFETPPEIWAGPTDQWRQLTSNNSALSPTWGKGQNLEWTNDGFNIEGWLVPPIQVESGKKYPMVVLIHGGPSSATMPEWPASFGMSRAVIAALSSRGYYVLLPNPRGSYGQGEEFTRANVKDLGGGDLRDILAGVDAAIKKYPIDPRSEERRV